MADVVANKPKTKIGKFIIQFLTLYIAAVAIIAISAKWLGIENINPLLELMLAATIATPFYIFGNKIVFYKKEKLQKRDIISRLSTALPLLYFFLSLLAAAIVGFALTHLNN